MPRRLALIAATLAAAVLLVGCGSDDDSSDDDRDTTTTEDSTSTTEADDADDPEATTESTEAPDDETTTESTEAPDESTTTTAGGGGEGDPEFCATYGAFDEQFEDTPDDTIEQLRAAAADLDAALDELVTVAPDELADDTELLSQVGDELVAAANDATTVEDAESAMTEVFSDEVYSSAADRVDTYFEERCPEANDDQADG